MKLSQLAFRNVKKSYKDYFVYFLTLMFSVCLFYTFNSFSSQESILELSAAQSEALNMVGTFMKVLSIFVSIVLAFLILYANNFLIRRRKKEFGVYMLLGMPKRHISRILVYETMFVGCLSLISGLLLGICCLQLIGMLTANMFQIKMNYHIVITPGSMLLTIGLFTFIFLIIMMFNTRVISKVSLIDLLQANKKEEKIRVKKLWVSIVLLVISLSCLAIAYYFTMNSLDTFMIFFLPIIVLGSVGTILFFISLSGFLLQFIRCSKRVYFQRLNMYVLRQINAKISTTSVSMGVVCLMLLLSIGALSCGLMMNSYVYDMYEHATPYSFSYHQYESIPKEDMKQLFNVEQAKNYHTISIYRDGTTMGDIKQSLNQEAQALLSKGSSISYLSNDMPIIYLSNQDYNQLMKSQGKPGVTLQEDEAFFISGYDEPLELIQKMEEQKLQYQAFDQTLNIVHKTDDPVGISTNMAPEVFLGVVLPDSVIQKETPQETIWNINLKDGVDETLYHEETEQRFTAYAQAKNTDYGYFSGITRTNVKDNVMSIGMLFVYIGLYLGIVFMISSAAILALQQLSEAEDSRKNYTILRKLGTPESMIHRSVFLQIAIYFMLPLGLAIIHSFVGVPVVSSGFAMMFGMNDMLTTNFYTGLIIVCIYGAYFLVTYQGYLAAIKKK